MPLAQPGEVVEAGGVALGQGDDVVDLQALVDHAAGHHARQVARLEGRAHVGGNRPPEMRDGPDVDAVPDDGGHDGVRRQRPRRGNRDGADAGDLAGLARLCVASHKGGVVDPTCTMAGGRGGLEAPSERRSQLVLAIATRASAAQAWRGSRRPDLRAASNAAST